MTSSNLGRGELRLVLDVLLDPRPHALIALPISRVKCVPVEFLEIALMREHLWEDVRNALIEARRHLLDSIELLGGLGMQRRRNARPRPAHICKS